MRSFMKTKTIDELCSAGKGSFQEFLGKKSAVLKKAEGKRRGRVQASRTNKHMAWAA
jgi:hypothetical protein